MEPDYGTTGVYQMEISFRVERTNYNDPISYNLVINGGSECYSGGGSSGTINITIPAGSTTYGKAYCIEASSLSITPKWELSFGSGPTACTNTATINDRDIPLRY